MMSSDSQKMWRCWSAVSVIRRSSGSRGRIEIRFSCCDSQFDGVHEQVAVALDAEPAVRGEVGVADHHDPRLRLAGVLGFGAGGAAPATSVAGADTAAASETGPGLSPLSVARHLALAASALDVGLAPSCCGLVSTNVCAVRAGRRRRSTGVTDRASGYAVSRLKRVGDRMRRVARGDRHRRVGAEQLAHAADVDDDVVADVDRPVLEQRDAGSVSGGASGLVRRIEQQAAACRPCAR